MLSKFSFFIIFLALFVSLSCTQAGKGQNQAFLAIQNGEFADLKKSIATNAELLNSRDELGNNLLITSALYGNTEIADFLIEKGLAVDDQNVFGDTPLMMAAWCGSLGTAQLLLKKGASINRASAGGWTPVFFAAMGKHVGHPDVLAWLISHGALVEQKDKVNMTALEWVQASGEGVKNIDLLKKK